MSGVLTLAMSALAPMAVSAQTNATYAYDVHGRLVSAIVTGSPASSASTALIDYDAAGNRTAVRSGTGTPPSSSPPVARNPTLSVYSGTTSSIAIGALATTSVAARIAAFSPPSGGGGAAIAGDGQSVSYTAPTVPAGAMCEPGQVSTVVIAYTVQNVSGGQSGSGTATVNVTGPAGPRPPRGQQCP